MKVYRGYHVSFDENELKRIREESMHDIEPDFCGIIARNALSFDLVVRDYEECLQDGFGKDNSYRLDLDPYLLGRDTGYSETLNGIPYDYYNDGAGSIGISMHSSYKETLDEIIDMIDALIAEYPLLAEYANKTDLTWADAEVLNHE